MPTKAWNCAPSTLHTPPWKHLWCPYSLSLLSSGLTQPQRGFCTLALGESKAHRAKRSTGWAPGPPFTRCIPQGHFHPPREALSLERGSVPPQGLLPAFFRGKTGKPCLAETSTRGPGRQGLISSKSRVPSSPPRDLLPPALPNGHPGTRLPSPFPVS